MKVSEEIAAKIEEYERLRYLGQHTKAVSLFTEIKEYFEQECGAKGFLEPFISNTPIGRRRTLDGEFCLQTNYRGIHYYRVKKSKKYVGYNYVICPYPSLDNKKDKVVCRRCGTEVQPETDEELRKEYPYYCPECDQNMYSFEVERRKE